MRESGNDFFQEEWDNSVPCTIVAIRIFCLKCYQDGESNVSLFHQRFIIGAPHPLMMHTEIFIAFSHIVNKDNDKWTRCYFASSGYVFMIERAHLVMSFVKMSILSSVREGNRPDMGSPRTG